LSYFDPIELGGKNRYNRFPKACHRYASDRFERSSDQP